MFGTYTHDLDDKYGWNDPFLSSRMLSQPDALNTSRSKVHRPDSVSPVLHGK